jgi:hypothetical protein
MKPLIIAFVVLLGVLVGVAWMNGRFGNTLIQKNKVIGQRVLYTEETEIGVEKQSEISLMGNLDSIPITGFDIELVYDSTVVRVDGVTLNDKVFDQLIDSSIDPDFGKIRIKASSGYAAGTIKTGTQQLVTIKMTGLKKGGMVITSGRRPEVTIWENGKMIEGDFTFRSSKVSVK